MGSTKDDQFAMFEEKVKRTVYVDNLSPQVTEPVLRTALDQFGTVVSVHFIPNYTEPINSSQCALVEMKDLKEAKSVISVISQFPFMISGMPRPVRARPAEVEMFDDRPVKPGRKISFTWLEKDDPDFEVAKKIKLLTQKHVAEVTFLLKHHLAEEEKLAKQQQEALKGNYKKYEIVESVMADGTARSFRVSGDVVWRPHEWLVGFYRFSEVNFAVVEMRIEEREKKRQMTTLVIELLAGGFDR